MKKITAGILAHVDAGKTTLTEAFLYENGSIRTKGRVDHKDTVLDNNPVERERGITVFSKQAVLKSEEAEIILLDTPGHVDFCAEMERVLHVLDYAVLLISAADGIQAHTLTVWKLLEEYEIPVFLFVNKMDHPAADMMAIMQEIKRTFSGHFVNFSENDRNLLMEEAALSDDQMLNSYLRHGTVNDLDLAQAVKNRKLFPCFFGSALKGEGVRELLDGIKKYSLEKDYPQEFAALVYKISRDASGSRLTHIKMLGGSLRPRDSVFYPNAESEKVNQIRVYTGERFDAVLEVRGGDVCAVTGLDHTFAGQALGNALELSAPKMEPVLKYAILLPEGVQPNQAVRYFAELEEEDPELHIHWNEVLSQIECYVMGEVQLEILQNMIEERFNIKVSFDPGAILYKETIRSSAEGVGHFEPLRHYAEVHLILEPGEPGSGVHVASNCPEVLLPKNWQHQILTNIKEKKHLGVLTGSEITDLVITLVAGRGHLKHTQGGDFREAAHRAVRNGLMFARSSVLEPYYEFELSIPSEYTGRAVYDIEQMSGTLNPLEGNGVTARLSGKVPVSTMRSYQTDLAAYSKGEGRLSLRLAGYGPCHNEEEVISRMSYQAEQDRSNDAGSVFCANGAGFYVPWQEISVFMHLPYLETERSQELAEQSGCNRRQFEETWIATEEVDQILERTYYANRGEKEHSRFKKKNSMRVEAVPAAGAVRTSVKKEKYLLVDGYNIIFAWDELKEIAKTSLEGARGRLLDILGNYQGHRQILIIVVFDAYKVKGDREEHETWHNIHVVYTKEAETADAYIEKYAATHSREYDITVATSDRLEQMIIQGEGCSLLSARELAEEVQRSSREIAEQIIQNTDQSRVFLGEQIRDQLK